ncbi:MAG TPA: DUF3566 domain-containing protein [Streptosporangiaceae bacterium]|nr:DUF3566 domain-containing protein [Streptosporangiaceae bacterium]
MDRRTKTSDGSGGASPTVVTAQHDDDNDLMADTDEDTQIMATSAVRAARQKVARAAAAAKEVLANGSSAPANAGTANAGTADAGTANAGSVHGGTAADEKDAAADQIPALPADTIGTPRDSSSLGFSRSAAAPVAPEADDWALGNDDGLSSSIATPEAEPAPTEEEPPSISTGTGWPADGTLFGTGADTGVGTERSDPAPAASPASEPTVSAASFVWETPDPEPTSPSSPARNFLRSSTTAKTSAPPPVSVAPAKASPAGASHASTRSKASSKRSSRQAHLTVARVEPWSVMKFSFVVSLVAFVILFVAVSVIYGTLSALGVFTSLQHVVQSVTSSQNSSGVNAAKWFTASRILSYTALLGALNIVLITAMCTIGAVVYNLTSRLIGGVEVTLRETE